MVASPVDNNSISTSTCQQENPTVLVPLGFFASGQFLALPAACQGGLIIEKRFYADLVAPGAAVGSFFDTNCTAVYPVGKVEFWAPTSHSDRQKAFQKRIACNRRLQQISQEPSSLLRARQILDLLYGWLGPRETEKIPQELIARLAGVLPKTIALVLDLRKHQSSQPELVAAP